MTQPHDRDQRDFYPTPPECLSAALAEFPYDLEGKSVWEPAAGAGALIAPLEATGAHVLASDLHQSEPLPHLTKQIIYGVDFLQMHPDPDGQPLFDLIVTNPPYMLAQEFIEHALTWSQTTMMLLRLSMLGSKRRYQMWRANPPAAIMPLVPRPQFVAVCGNRRCKKQYPIERSGQKCDACGRYIVNGADNSEYAWVIWSRLNWPTSFTWIKWRN